MNAPGGAMLGFDQAQQTILELAGPPGDPGAITTLPLQQARGRTLATDVLAVLDLPGFDHSAMDGYALCHADLERADQPDRLQEWPGPAGHDAHQWLPLQQHCYAGDSPAPLLAGQATRIFTGGALPHGADTVVMQEHAYLDGARVRLATQPAPGQHVRRRGEFVRAQQLLASAGTLLGPAQLALLAAQGIAHVAVRRPLRIGILSNGDELAAPGTPLRAGQVYNCNGVMLAGLAEGLGALPSQVRHVADQPDAMRSALRSLCAECDLVLSVGGASVGERDLVRPALQQLGAGLAFWKVNMKPGKPVAVARVGSCPVVCLPGNPVATFTVFTLLVTPLIRHMQGRVRCMPQLSRLPLIAPELAGDGGGDGSTGAGRVSSGGGSRGGGGRTLFALARCGNGPDGKPRLRLHASQSAADVSALASAGGLARIDADYVAGQAVVYYDFAHWLA